MTNGSHYWGLSSRHHTCVQHYENIYCLPVWKIVGCESSWPEERWKVKIQSGQADTIAANLGPENLDSPLLSIIHFPNNYGALNILAADREQEMLWEQWELPNHHWQSKLFVFFHRLSTAGMALSVSRLCTYGHDDLGHDGSINILSREDSPLTSNQMILVIDCKSDQMHLCRSFVSQCLDVKCEMVSMPRHPAHPPSLVISQL